MPERWLAELRKLDSLEPTADVLERAKKGPRRPSPVPSARGRLGVAIIALLIAIVGGSAAFLAFRDHRAETPISSSGFHALWPEQVLAEAQDAQASADAGDPKVDWRTDPALVAVRFSKHVLGWARTVVTEQMNVEETVVIDLTSAPGPCGFPGCPEGEHRVTVTLARLIEQGERGIWSVVHVDSGALLSLPIALGEELDVRVTVTVPTTLPEGTQIAAGYIQLGPCGLSGVSQTTSVHGSKFEFVVGGEFSFENSCTTEPSLRSVSGYVWAYTSDAFHPSGQPFGSLDSLPDVGHILELAGVPVQFVPPAGASPCAASRCPTWPR